MRLALPHSASLEESNFSHFVLDIVWFGLALPATSRFLSVYAIRLGAEANELSLLTALPALVLLFSASLSNWWMRRTPNTKKALFWPALLFRLVFLLPAFTPLIPIRFQSVWLIVSLALPALAQGISSVVFMVLMLETVDEKRVPPLLSQRSLALNVTLGLSGLALGVWLEKAPFPLNYQAMYVLAFGLALVSMWHVTQVRLRPMTAPKPVVAAPAINPWRSPAFRPVGLTSILMHLAFFSVVSLLPLHLVNNLGAGEGFMALYGVAELTAAAAVSAFCTRILRYISHRSLVALALTGTAVGALLIALAPSLYVTLLAAALIGCSWSAANIALYAFFSATTPPEQRGPFTTAFTQVMFAGQFLGPMIGSALSGLHINLVVVIIIGAGLRLLAAVLIQSHMPDWFKRTLHLSSQPR